MRRAVRLLNQSIILLALPCILVACKSSDKFDLLQGGGSGTSNVDSLTITTALPEASNIILEIGDTQDFLITAQAPLGRNISYTWSVNGTVVSQGTTFTHSFNATSGNVGNHVVEVVANDTKSTKNRIWNIKVNEPPDVSAVTAGTPRVSVGSSILITASTTDANNDPISYTWLLNGLPSSDLIGNGATATLTGNAADVGSVSITVIADDGTAQDSHTWTAEVNYFPMACNTLAVGQICTYGGNPSVGDNENPASPVYDIRIQPIGQAQDSLGNLFIADYGNNVVWYWNRTASPVTRVGITIPAHRFTVVAGSGELSTTGDGLSALTAAINRPRAVWYNDVSDVLYIAEYGGNRVRYVDGSGTIYTGMGTGSNVHGDGASAFTHTCASPSALEFYNNSLYVACYGSHRIKRWDLLTDLAYVFYGNGTNSIGANGSAPNAAPGGQPYDISITSEGMYVTHPTYHRIRFIKFAGGSKNFWQGNPSAVTVASNTVSTIIGTGSTGNDGSGNSLAINIGTPSGIAVVNDYIFFNIRNSNGDRFYLANNSASDVAISGLNILARTTGRITGTAAGYNGSGVAMNLASVNEPYEISVDVLNPNILIFSDYGNNRLRQLDLGAARIQDLVGSGNLRNDHYGDPLFPTYQHYFHNTNGVDYDEVNRTVFFVDQNNNRIRSIDAYGRTQTVLGIGYGAPNADNEPPTSALMAATLTGTSNLMNGLHVLPDSSIIHTNSRVHNVRVWNRSGTSTSYGPSYVINGRVSNVAGDHVTGVGNGPNGPALASLLNFPSDVNSYMNGPNLEIFVVDQQNHCIRMLDHLGNMNAVLGTCGVSGNSGNDELAGLLQMNRPHSIAVDAVGNLVISDTYNSKIRYWNRTGSAMTFAGLNVDPNHVVTIACINGTVGSATENVVATASRCNQPMGIDIHGTQVCFAQYARHNVRCINLNTGRISTVAGRVENIPTAGSPVGFEQEGISATSATLYNPVDVVFDSAGDLLISDRSNHIIRKVRLAP